MTPEGAILKSITEWLAVERIWFIRMNTGAVVSQYKGKSRMFQFGRKGCADILAIVRYDFVPVFTVLWLEVKAPKGKQSEAQHEFQKEVEAEGHRYAIVQSIEDVQDAVNAL